MKLKSSGDRRTSQEAISYFRETVIVLMITVLK